MTVPTYRSPLRLITANGSPLPKVFAHRTTRGWNQALATAEIVIPWPPPAQVGKWSQVVVRDGISALFISFVGYVTGMQNTLWPGTMALQCEDRLALAKYFKPSSNHDLSNKTDQAAVSYILTQVGIPYSAALIGGTGKKIGAATSQALTWTKRETALAKIQQIDQVSARDHGSGNLTMFRTFADAGGAIRRVELANVPGLTAARTFTEGIDLEAGSATIENVEPKTIVTVAGDHGILSSVTDGGANTWAIVSNPDFYANPLLQQAVTDGTYLGTDVLASVLLQRFNLNLIRLNFTTWREDLISAVETDRFDSDHCMVTLNAFVQSVVRGADESGGFSQQVSLVSAREFNVNPKAAKNFNPFTGLPVLPPGDLLPPPTPDSVQAAFTVLAIDVELVLIADVETLIYTAVCEDASTSSGGTIATRAWTTTGSPTPASGSGVTFNPSWTSLAGATVTLTVTDSLGNVDILTQIITQTMGSPVRSRDLFAAATGALEAFSGADRTWRVYTTGIAACGVVANGPLWADGDTVYRSADFLASPPNSSVPLGGEDVACIWTELDLDENAVVVGLNNGYVAFSSDAGATWVVKVGPDPPNAPRKVILSRFNPGEVHAITATGYYQSADFGEHWGLIREGDYRDLDLNPFRNWAVEVLAGVGTMIDAVTGDIISGSGSDDGVAVTSAILADRGYLLAANNDAWFIDSDGGTTLTAGTDTPVAEPQDRGLMRDGSFPEILYAALGDGGVWKSTDGLRATYWPLRKPSVGNAGTGPWLQIGSGLLSQPPTLAVGFVVLTHTEGNGVGIRATAGGWSRPTTTGAPKTGQLFSTAISRDDVTRMYLAESTDGGSPSASRFWYSTDSGVTWTQQTSVPSNAAWMESPTAGTIYVAGQKSGSSTPGIYRSTNDGASWTRILTDTSVSGVDSVSVTDTRIWFTSLNAGSQGSYNAVRYCALAGTGETQISGTNLTGPDILVRAFDDNLALAVCFAAGKVLKCVPAASAVDITPSGLGYTLTPFAAEPISASAYLVYGDGSDNKSHIVRTADSGATWTEVYTSVSGHKIMTLGATDYQFLARLSSNPNYVVALGYASSSYQQDVHISQNAGLTWITEKNTADESDGFGGYVMGGPGGLSAP